MKPSPLVLPYAPPSPDVVVLTALPPRLQRMIALLLAHEEALCRPNVGSVELHFHADNLEAKLWWSLTR